MARFNQLASVLSGLALLTSIIWHALILGGREFPAGLSTTLFLGIFAAWVPAILAILPLREEISQRRGLQFYNLVFDGAPLWMYMSAVLLLAYAFLNFVLATGMLTGSVSNHDPRFPRVASGVAMALYATAMTILRAAAIRVGPRHCHNGHRVPQGRDTCSICGASVAEDAPGQRPGA